MAACNMDSGHEARQRTEVRTGERQGGWRHAAPKQTPQQRRAAMAQATGTRSSLWK